jgi:hypothetical protein
MATGKIRADTGIMNPCPREKIHARARARHPSRAALRARAHYPRACFARGHARIPVYEARCSHGARVTGVTGRPAAGVGEPRVEEPCRSRCECRRLNTGGLTVVLGRSFGAGTGRPEFDTRKQASGVGEQT